MSEGDLMTTDDFSETIVCRYEVKCGEIRYGIDPATKKMISYGRALRPFVPRIDEALHSELIHKRILLTDSLRSEHANILGLETSVQDAYTLAPSELADNLVTALGNNMSVSPEEYIIEYVRTANHFIFDAQSFVGKLSEGRLSDERINDVIFRAKSILKAGKANYAYLSAGYSQLKDKIRNEGIKNDNFYNATATTALNSHRMALIRAEEVVCDLNSKAYRLVLKFCNELKNSFNARAIILGNYFCNAWRESILTDPEFDVMNFLFDRE